MKLKSIMYRFSVLIIGIFTMQSAQAGILGFLGDVSSISSAMSNAKGKGNILLPNHEQMTNVNIQKALTIMDYYIGPLDGNLNTYDSRKSIMDFQEIASTKKQRMPSYLGILSNFDKQDLLYYYELADEFESNIFGPFQIQPRLQTLYNATQAHEKILSRSRNTVLSSAMYKSINQSTRNNLPIIHLQSLNDRGYVVDDINRFIWQDKEVPIEKMTFKAAEAYCAKLDIDGINKWILPWQTRLDSLYKNIEKGRLKLEFQNKTPVDDIWSTNNKYSFKQSNGESVYHRSKNESEAAVRCVYKYD